MTLYLRQTLSEPITGWWDGGYPKSVFDWRIDRFESRRQGWTIVGSTEANRWFHVEPGKTEKATLGNARRALSARARREGVECTFEYIEKGL